MGGAYMMSWGGLHDEKRVRHEENRPWQCVPGGEWCYWLFVIGYWGRGAFSSAIHDLLGDLGVLAVNLSGCGESDPAGWLTEVRAPLDAD